MPLTKNVLKIIISRTDQKGHDGKSIFFLRRQRKCPWLEDIGRKKKEKTVPEPFPGKSVWENASLR